MEHGGSRAERVSELRAATLTGITVALLNFAVISARAADAEAPAKALPAVTITDDGMQFQEPHKPDLRYASRLFRFNNGGPQNYGISLTLDQHKQADGTWKTRHSYVGMPIPTEANWYHSGFFSINANGKDIHDRDPIAEVTETGSQGVLDFKWDHPLVLMRARLIAEPGSDHLLLELRWEPKPELKTLGVSFSCFPQGYRPSEPDRLAGKKLDRHAITTTRDIQQVQTAKLNLPEEWWLLYQDNTLEHSPTYGPGGCGLAMLPDDVEGATVSVTDYPVETKVIFKAASGRARFALWDFLGKRDVVAKQTLIAQAPALRERMQSGSWMPTAVSAFTATAERQRVDQLAKDLGKPGAKRVTTLREKLAALEAQLAALPSATQPLQTERDVRAALIQYRTLYWQAERPVRKSVRTLILAGPFAYAWRVEKIAKAVWGNDAVRRGAYIWKYWIGHRISYFPSTMEELLSYDVVVLADIPQDPLTQDKRQMLADFVKLGGGLLVLGGPYAYGGGAWKDSPLEPLLPVKIEKVFDLQPVETDAHITLTSAGTQYLGNLLANPKSQLGVVQWRNEVHLRPGAEVWMTVGRFPCATFTKQGEGRVLTVLGAAVGEAPEGQVAFYDSPGWPELVKRMLSYLARGK